MEMSLIQTGKTCIITQETIINCINRLKSIALRAGCLDSTDENIDLMILSEEGEKKMGW
jgi:hypothetical protein